MEKCAWRHIRHSLLGIIACLSMFMLAKPEGIHPASALRAGEGILSGHIIAVDAGHGGYDGGARAKTGQWEKIYNLQIAQKLEATLQGLGAQVVMTRTGDYALCDVNPKGRKKRQDMERRADLILVGGAEMVVSIHLNEYRDAGQSGPQVFYRKDCPAGKVLAEALQAQMIQDLKPRKHRMASTGDFYILSLGLPSVLVECGFLSSPAEAALLATDAYQQQVAEAIAGGIVAWYELADRPQAAEREAR